VKYFMGKKKELFKRNEEKKTASQSAFFRLFVRRRIEMNDKHQLLKLITLHHNNFFSFSLTCKAFFLLFDTQPKQAENEKMKCNFFLSSSPLPGITWLDACLFCFSSSTPSLSALKNLSFFYGGVFLQWRV
jgi:hypothetical protein